MRPVLEKATPDTAAVSGKLDEQIEFVTFNVMRQYRLAEKEGDRVVVTAVVDVANEHPTPVPFTKQGEATPKSVVRLIVRVLLLMVAEVSILMASWLLDETMELEGVTEMMRWASPIIKSRPINIIILLQIITSFESYSLTFNQFHITFTLHPSHPSPCIQMVFANYSPVYNNMNLSLVLLVLSIIVAYLIYDMFKKSRQEQQLAQVQASRQHQTNKLRPSYSAECAILKGLYEDRMNSLVHKRITIHLLEEAGQKGELSSQGKRKVKEVIDQLRSSYKIHILMKKNAETSNPLLCYLRELDLPEVYYKSAEGAVAILRQFNPNIHLESDVSLYKTLVQYLPNVWINDGARTGQHFVNQYKSQWQMVISLGQLQGSSKKKEE